MKHDRDYYVPGLGRIRMRPVDKHAEFYVGGGGGEKMADETRRYKGKLERFQNMCPKLTPRAECVKDSCAWYDDVYDQCAILVIARELSSIAKQV